MSSPDEYISPLMAREKPKAAPSKAFTLPSQQKKPDKPYKNFQNTRAVYTIDPSWPQSLIEKLSNSHCMVCNVKMTSHQQAKTHYDGKPHQKGINRFLLHHGQSQSEPKETKTNSSSDEKEQPETQMVRPDTSVSRVPKGPELCPFNFSLDCTNLPKMHIHSDGSIEGKHNSQASDEDIAKISSCLIKYILKEILKAKRNKDKEKNKPKKRKIDDKETPDENAIGLVDGRHRRIAYYSLILSKELWLGRAKFAKTMEASKPTNSPLQNELAISEKMVERADFGYLDIGGGRMTLYFDIHVWQNIEEPYRILVTGKASGSSIVQSAMMKPMFSLFTSIAVKQLKAASLWVNRPENKKKE